MEERPARPDPSRLRRSTPRSRPARPRRKRPWVAGAVVGVLALMWLLLAHQAPSAPAAAPPAVSGSTAAVDPADPTSVAALHALFGDAQDCTDGKGATPSISCRIDDVQVDAQLVGLDQVLDAYTAATGVRVAPGSGPPLCATGKPEERAWSRPGSPSEIVGRYACRVEDGGQAAMWWTDEHGVLFHAVAADADLGRLFGWWRAHLDG